MSSSTVTLQQTAGRALAITAVVIGLACAASLPSQAQQSGPPPSAATASPTCSGVGLVWWAELLTDDVDAANKFYSSVLGWTSKSADVRNLRLPPRTPADRYVVFSAEGTEAAGLMRQDHSNAVHAAKGWVVYFQVRDLDHSLTLVRVAGGNVLKEPFETGEGNRMALIQDPTGAVVGLVQPGKNEPC
jgi:hypothetical protein